MLEETLARGAFQPRRIASTRQAKQTSAAGSATTRGAQPELVPDHRDGGADQRRRGVELAAEHQRHPAGRARRGASRRRSR